MIDQLRQLAIFAKTIDQGSFRGAARELKLSPSVVSHHISELESEMGVILLYRSTRQLSLTPEGERLLEATRNMLEAIEHEFLDISGNAGEPRGNLSLTMPSVLSESSITTAIGSFSRSYPSINLKLDFSDLRKELIGDGFDIAIRMGLKPKMSPNTRILTTFKRRMIASRTYLDNRDPITTPEDLNDVDWCTLQLVHNRPFLMQRNGKKVRIKPSYRVQSNDARSLYQLVKSGVGLAVLPEFVRDDESIEVVLPDWRLESVVVYAEIPHRMSKRSLPTLLIEHLTKALAK